VSFFGPSWVVGNHAPPGAVVNMLTVCAIRKWCERALGVPAVLVIERVGERNRVALRFVLADVIYESDVSTLRDLHRKRPKHAEEAILRLLGFAAVGVL